MGADCPDPLFFSTDQDIEEALIGSLSSEQRATIETPAAVTFPRAQDAYANGYYRMYAHDMKPLMRQWVQQRIATFTELFGLNYKTEAEATMCMRILASREVSRDLNDNERSLISEVVRDLVTAHTALRNRERDVEQARQAELGQEVL